MRGEPINDFRAKRVGQRTLTGFASERTKDANPRLQPGDN